MSDWIEVCALEDIPSRGARRLQMFDTEVAIFRTQGNEVYAIENKCPHKQGPLSEGIVHDSAVTCPLHSWVIDLQTGQARGADEGCVRTFKTDKKNGRVFVKLN